jgi:hypothetical protein
MAESKRSSLQEAIIKKSSAYKSPFYTINDFISGEPSQSRFKKTPSIEDLINEGINQTSEEFRTDQQHGTE